MTKRTIASRAATVGGAALLCLGFAGATDVARAATAQAVPTPATASRAALDAPVDTTTVSQIALIERAMRLGTFDHELRYRGVPGAEVSVTVGGVTTSGAVDERGYAIVPVRFVFGQNSVSAVQARGDSVSEPSSYGYLFTDGPVEPLAAPSDRLTSQQIDLMVASVLDGDHEQTIPYAAQPGAEVRVTVDDEVTTSAVADDDGIAQVPVVLTPGPNALRVVQEWGGETSKAKVYGYTIDGPRGLDIEFRSDATYVPGQPFTVRGTLARAEGTAERNLYYWTARSHSRVVAVAADGAFEFTVPASEAVPVDEHGHTQVSFVEGGRSGWLLLTPTDGEAPESPLAVTSSTSFTKGERVTVSGTNSPGQTVKLYSVKNGTETFARDIATDAAGKWSFTTGAPYTVDSVTWKFVSGERSVTETFTGTNPSPSPLAVTSSTSFTKGERVTVSGTNSPGQTVKLYSVKNGTETFARDIATDAAGKWSFTTGAPYTVDSVTWKFVSGERSVTETFTGK